MISCPIQVRFADCDLAGHIHNVAYLHYFETGRIHFLTSGLDKDWDWKRQGLILKKNAVDYMQPAYFPDHLDVEVWCSHIGNKSFTLAYSVKVRNGAVKAIGTSLLVCFDYTAGQSIEIPAEMLSHLQKHLDPSGHNS